MHASFYAPVNAAFAQYGRGEKANMSDENTEYRSGSSWQLPAIIVLGLIALGGLGFGWNASSKLDSTKQAVQASLKTTQQSVEQDITTSKDRSGREQK